MGVSNFFIFFWSIFFWRGPNLYWCGGPNIIFWLNFFVWRRSKKDCVGGIFFFNFFLIKIFFGGGQKNCMRGSNFFFLIFSGWRKKWGGQTNSFGGWSTFFWGVGGPMRFLKLIMWSQGQWKALKKKLQTAVGPPQWIVIITAHIFFRLQNYRTLDYQSNTV